MSPLTLINRLPDVPAQVWLSRDGDRVARIPVPASGGRVEVPMGASVLRVTAEATVAGYRIRTAPRRLTTRAAGLCARVRQVRWGLDFEMGEAPGTRIDTLVLENTWRGPVLFRIETEGTPLVLQRVVDPGCQVQLSTRDELDVAAVLDGVTVPGHQPVTAGSEVVLEENDGMARLEIQR